MPTLHRDIETRSTADLATVGAWRYAADPSTEILCVGFAVDDCPVAIWTPGQPIPEAFFAAARDPDWIVAAHNDQFETAIEARLLQPRYGWPIVPIERHACTMAAALASALPGSLDGACKALGLDLAKDADGYRRMLQMSKPRKLRKGEDPSEVHWIDSAEHRAHLARYCSRDVELERELHRRLAALSADEQASWQLDATINARGFHVDTELAEAARKIVRAEQEAIDLEIAEITGGAVTAVNQVGKIAALLRDRGHNVTNVTKQSVKALLAKQPDGDIERLLTLRQEGGRAAARKLDSLIAGADADQRLRGCFRFHGAATGRWSGARFQPQNLKKSSLADLDGAVAVVRSGLLERVREFGPPLAVVGDLSRAMIRAKPGHDLIGADYSAIESRVLSWLAGEKWKIDVYRKFDSTGDPLFEPYCQTASRILRRTITPDDRAGRQIGKVADLALGYGGGIGAWRRFATSDIRSDSEIQRNISDWRRTHPNIVRYWKALEQAAHRCIRTGLPSQLGNVGFEMRGTTLLMVLPSGRRIAYPEAKLVAGKFDGSFQIHAKDNAKGMWLDGKVWFGTLIENLVQGVARDLLAAAMLRLENAGYPIVIHCHDEAVAEIPKSFGSVEAFLKLITTLPAWAEGVPVAAKPWRRECYAEAAEHASAPAKGISTRDAQCAEPVASSPVRNSEVPATPASPQKDLIVAPRIVPPSAKTHVPLTDLIADIGANGKILCPWHADGTPSLHVYDDHVHCFSCGAHADAVDYLMMLDGMSRNQALAVLEHRAGTLVVRKPPTTTSDPVSRLRAAWAIWNASKPIASTPAIRYLADVRAIDVDALPQDDAALRYHPQCPFGIGRLEPCLVALYRDVLTDEPAGLHRIALTPGVFAGAKVERMTLGSWPRPRAIKLWPANGQLFLGEGIETVLAAATVLNKRPAWAAGSAANISKFPVLRGAQLTLLVDFDDAGVAAANACRERYRRHGRDVRCLRPKQQRFDFNDVVREIVRKAAAA